MKLFTIMLKIIVVVVVVVVVVVIIIVAFVVTTVVVFVVVAFGIANILKVSQNMSTNVFIMSHSVEYDLHTHNYIF